MAGNNCYFTDCAKIFNDGMHSDVYKPIWFKFGVMIDTIDLNILILD